VQVGEGGGGGGRGGGAETLVKCGEWTVRRREVLQDAMLGLQDGEESPSTLL